MKVFIPVLISLGLGVSTHAQNPSKPVQPNIPRVVKPPVPSSSPSKPSAPPRAVPWGGKVQPAIPGGRAGVVPPPVPMGRAAELNVGLDRMAAAAGQVIDGSNWDDQDVADEYTKYTGKRVLLSSATQALEIRFYQRGPLTNRQAANLLVKVLDMEGFVFVPSGANEVKLLPKAQGTGSNGPAELEGIIDDPNDIPQGDAYISYFMKLGFIKPEEAVRTFTQSLHGLGPGAKIAPVPNASAVLITGKAAFIRKLINQKRYIDVAAGNVDTTWVQLKYADSEELATTLNEIMNSQQQSNTTAGVTTGASGRTTGNRPSVPGVKVPAASTATSAGEDIPVQIVASPRLNKIFIMGRPVDIIFVEGLAREFDAPPNNNNFFKRKLRFMIASDFLDVAAKALEAVGGSGKSSQSGSSRSSNRQTSSNQNRNQSSRNVGSSRQGGGASSGAESVQEFNVSDVPESIVIGKTLIVADNLNNSILVQGPPESLRVVSELIDKLDGRPQQVMISTVFGEIELLDGKDVGVSIGRVSGDTPDPRRAGGGGINTGIGGLLAGSEVDLAALNTAGTGLNVYGTIKNLTGRLNALKTNSNFKLLSRPTVYTANNRKAVITSGSRIAVPTNTFNSGTTGTSTNIEYREVVLRFEVVPLINSEDEVTLRISLVNDTVGAEQEVGELIVPTIGTKTISTTVTVPNNSTVVLGGLVTETVTDSQTGVPVLSQIPGVGRLFRRNKKDMIRKELIIFIQPKIVGGEVSQREAQSDMEGRYDVAPSTRDFADGVLPGKVDPSSKKPNSKGHIPKASKRPSLRYPTRR
ncbi:MAG: hypothetical protein KJO21_13045 [Verrucomicrobiae bacterium]|nr:hypothetical protein [Verrucomicrobiae bacterium]NNJ44233.1 hypothetical protein [Akkermansiaceae bacterium]